MIRIKCSLMSNKYLCKVSRLCVIQIDMTYRHILRARVIKLFAVFVMCLSTTVVLSTMYTKDFSNVIKYHDRLVAAFYDERRDWNTSKLGAILYKNERLPKKQDKTFKVLIYKYWDKLKSRHLYYFGSTIQNPLKDCSVDNCIFTGKDSEMSTADAVVVHIQRGGIPKVSKRNTKQRWIFLSDESPHNSFSLARVQPKLKDFDGIFNWSMTYRSDADIPVPYGRTVTLKTPRKITERNTLSKLIPYWKNKRKDALISILMSNCGVTYRNELIESLKLYTKVHVLGNCGEMEFKKSCPGHFRADCNILSQYLFYLVIENGKCYEYMTEKLFYNAYSKGAIPIIQGPSVEDCRRLLPPNSYLHFDNYESIETLIKDVITISNDYSKLLSYHRWRVHYDVLNEHGYFGSKSYHLCRVCEALNYNDGKVSVYREKDLKRFLDPLTLCR